MYKMKWRRERERETEKHEMEIGMKCHLADSLGSAPTLLLMFSTVLKLFSCLVTACRHSIWNYVIINRLLKCCLWNAN